MKRTIILNAGHSINDPDTITNTIIESIEVIKIRNRLSSLLKRNLEVAEVPDDLNLQQSIEWVNTHYEEYKKFEDGLAFSVHLNSSNSGQDYGAETYYYEGYEKSRRIAKTIIDKYCSLTRFRNRGAKPDTISNTNKSKWIRETIPWSCLIECYFIDNDKDIKKLQEEYNEIAWAIYSGICDVYNIKPINQEESDVIKKDIQKNEKNFKFQYNPLDKIFITQRFGERPKVYKQWGMNGHNGVDFRTRFDDSLDGKRKVYAVLDGIISESVAKIKDDYGKYVRLIHSNGSTTIYAHLDSINVSVHQEIKAGQILGISDNTHLTPAGSTGSHLHFGYRPSKMNWHNGYKGYINPESYFI